MSIGSGHDQDAGRPLLRIEELSIGFGERETGTVVDGLSLSVRAGEVLAVVGE